MLCRPCNANEWSIQQGKNLAGTSWFWPSCRQQAQFVQKMWLTVCHDIGVFLYMFVAPFTIVWAFLGLAKDGLDGCGSSRITVRAISALLLLYLLFTVLVAMISCCWEFVRLTDRAQNQPPAPQVGDAQHQHYHGSHVLQHVFAPGFEHGQGYHGTSWPSTAADIVAQLLWTVHFSKGGFWHIQRLCSVQ
jgi:hypothetical protein